MKSDFDAPIDGDIEETGSFDEREVEPSAVATTTVERGGGERAGLYLAVLAALAVPSLIILALYLPSSPVGGALGTTETETPSTGLDRIELDSSGNVSVEVAGSGEAQDAVTTEIGSAVSIEADERANIALAADPSTDNTANDEATDGDLAAAPQLAEPADPTETATADSTIAPSTAPTPEAPSSTSPSTTNASPTAESPATPAEPVVEPAQFGQRIDVGRIGETTLQFRFSARSTTAYVATVRSGTQTVSSASGTADANQLVNESIQGLTPGTDYTVQVTLNGPPSATSPQVAFRTSGGADVVSPIEAVAVQNLRLASTGSTQFEVRYESNVCANGSFVIREQGGPVVGSNSGQAAGCTTRHLGIPGFWTPALKPNTTYVLTVQVEANGAGNGEGNIATQTLVVTTSA